MKNLLILCLLFVFFSAETQAANKKGWRESYGGDSNIAEFQDLAYTLFSALDENYLSDTFGIHPVTFLSVIKTVKISCQSNLMLDGQAKEAINFPAETPKRILLDCDKWKTAMPYNKMNLVAHEYLHLLYIDDSDYKISSFLVKKYNREPFPDQGKVSLDLIIATANCDINGYSAAIKNGANINYTLPAMTTTPLISAIENNCTVLLKDLLKLGVVFSDSNLPTAVHNLIYRSLQMSDETYFENLKQTLDIIYQEAPQAINLNLSYSNKLTSRGDTLINLYFDNDLNHKEKYMTCFTTSNLLHPLALQYKKPSSLYSHEAIKKIMSLLKNYDLDDRDKNSCGDDAVIEQ